MTSIELVEVIANDTGMKKKDVGNIILCYTKWIKLIVESGDNVKIRNFGTFSKKIIKPTQKGPVKVTGRQTIKFKPSRGK